MSKIKAFFYVFYKSLTSRAYYKEIINKETLFSIKYLLVLSLIVTLLISVTTTIKATPEVQTFTNDFTNQTISTFPDDLVITSKDNVISVNQQEPYSIKTPEMFGTELSTSEKSDEYKFPKNFITFDSEGTLDKLKEYDTLILINKSNFLIQNPEGNVDVYPIKDVPNGDFSKQNLMELGSKVTYYSKYIPLFLFLVVFIPLLIANLGIRVIYFLVPALLIFIVGKGNNLELSFRKYYQIAIHSATLPIIIEGISHAAGFPIKLPFWFLGLNVIIGVLMILDFKKGAGETNIVATNETPAATAEK